MKKLVATLFVVLLVFSLSLSAQADSGLAALEGKLSAFMASSGERHPMALASETPTTYGVVIGYFTVVSGQWWTGLAVTNNSGSSNVIKVGCFDTSGNAVGGGSITLGANAMQVDQIAAFIKTGSVPQKGAIAVFGTAPFIVDRFLGNVTGGGIGEVQLESKVY